MAKKWPGDEVARRRRRGADSVEPKGIDSGCHQLKAALRNHFNASKVQQTTPTITIQAGNMTGSSSVSTTRLKPSTPPNKLRKQAQEDQRSQHRRRRRTSNRRCSRRAPNILNCSHTNRGLSSLLREQHPQKLRHLAQARLMQLLCQEITQHVAPRHVIQLPTLLLDGLDPSTGP